MAYHAPGAPDWARAGDQKSSDGSLFVCEGAGATEELAQRAALAACSAKICELCGVEVKSTVTTRETLSGAKPSSSWNASEPAARTLSDAPLALADETMACGRYITILVLWSRVREFDG